MRTRTGIGFLAAFATLFYFSEGFPFGLINDLLPLYLRSEGVSLTRIGMLSTVGLAWTLKLLWAPAVDELGSYRRWITAALAALTAGLIVFATVPLLDSPLFWVVVTLLALASATQDIAVDAFTITATEKKWLGLVNSIRVTAYRIGMIVAGGGFAAIAQRTGWRSAFGLAAVISGALLVASLFLPDRERRGGEKLGLIAGLRAWLTQPRAAVLLAIVLLYKLGDSALNPMVRPFWVDRGFTLTEIGVAVSVVGVSAVIAGAWIAGAVIARRGLYASMIWFGILQIGSNVAYALVAQLDLRGVEVLYGASIIESLTYGLGTGTFLAFLMAICDRERAATEYALLSALFGLSRSLSGSISGALTDATSYTAYFWITFLLGIPGLLLVPLVRGQLEDREVEAPRPAEV